MLACKEGIGVMKEVIIIWVAIILVLLSILFPPFGYTRETIHSIFETDPVRLVDTQFVVPWTYVGHRFIFSEPPTTDPRFKKRYNSLPGSGVISRATVDDMKIAWHVIAIQVAVIILVAGGLVFTLMIQRRHVS